ncbi:zinc-binding dehydrogenase [Reyranella sp.]|uniref:zinc-binding dehydrogenase n=1 Tax=Reyranella sp. TaxID=1929291 RepID=UPI002F93BB15
MPDATPTTGLELRSLIKKNGELELSLAKVPVPEPADDQVVVKVEATPINPSDLGLLLGPADMKNAAASGSGEGIVVKAKVPEASLPLLAARLDQPMPVGNEGAGTVVKAGKSDEAQALKGKIVSMIGGAMYAQYRLIKARDCQALPSGTTAAEGASWFVNPLTALGMTETMKREGHKALVHTAAASNLGQMLNRICLEDGIGLVNIVRSPAQAKILRDAGAKQVCDSTEAGFTGKLAQALAETGATIAFDAIGGGRLASQILACMEMAITRSASDYSRYGSSVHKQVYIYGSLDPGPVELVRNYGMAWGVGGWLLTPFLQKIGRADQQRLRERVARSLKTTFASHYTRTISLPEALRLENIALYSKRATGEKFLINPNKAG